MESHSFVIRIWQQQGTLWEISDPATGWCATFQDLPELQAALVERLNAPVPPMDGDSSSSEEEEPEPGRGT